MTKTGRLLYTIIHFEPIEGYKQYKIYYLVRNQRIRFLGILRCNYNRTHGSYLCRLHLVHMDCVWHMGVDMHYLYKPQSNDNLHFECNQLSKM